MLSFTTDAVRNPAERIEAQQGQEHPRSYYVARLGTGTTSLSGVATSGTVLYGYEAPFQSKRDQLQTKALAKMRGDPRVLSKGKPISEMFELAVRPEARRCGLANALSLTALKGLDSQQTLRVRTLAENPSLLEMYAAMGLSNTGQNYRDDEGLEIVKLEADAGAVRSSLADRFTAVRETD